ncbi:MAG: hypothetical protein NWR72_14770 [Bacteroidia bacterium]|nr:hypothetical protein [Bacteroidia bacterium]
MNVVRSFSLFSLIILSATTALAQRPLPEIERELATLASDILLNDSLTIKIKQNKLFARLLISTLERADSYHYPWDSLQTVSVLTAEDDAFRIFTWHIVDRNYNQYRGEQYHYYFGLIQRKITKANGETDYVVIPLIENAPLVPGVENMQLDNKHWLGALYYPLRNHNKTIPAYTTKTRSMTTRGDSMYVLGQGWVTGEAKAKTRKTTYYLLLGWNGGDNLVNYKMAEALYFDEDDPTKVIFGAGIFYFDAYNPRMRALFRYQENSPFSLNMGMVKSGGGLGKKSEEMIIYDHMGVPNFKEGEPVSIYQAGPDGAYDGFWFDKKQAGFRWFQNVELADNITSDMAKEISENQEEIVRAKLAQLRYWAELMDDQALVSKIEKLESKDKLTAKSVKLIRQSENDLVERLEQKSKAEQERLKNAGINPKQ